MNEAIVRDLSRAYNGTWVCLFDKKEKFKRSVNIRDIGYDDKMGARIYFTEGSEDRLHKLSDVEILPLPSSRVFDLDGITWVYEHQPRRQWRKGICDENSSFSSPVRRMLHTAIEKTRYKYAMGVREVFSSVGLQNLFIPKHSTISSAIEKIRNGEAVSVTITNKNYISSFLEEDQYILWRMNTPLCIFYPEKKTAITFNEMYDQETLDFFMRRNYYYVIEHTAQ